MWVDCDNVRCDNIKCDGMGCDSMVSDGVLCSMYSEVEEGVRYISMLLYIQSQVLHVCMKQQPL